jgi:psiF repeat
MRKFARNSMLLRAIAVAALTMSAVGVSGVAFGDDPPPTDNPPLGGRHHHDPAWAACKKQADDQKLQPGDARREFMQTCMKSAKSSTTPPAT